MRVPKTGQRPHHSLLARWLRQLWRLRVSLSRVVVWAFQWPVKMICLQICRKKSSSTRPRICLSSANRRGRNHRKTPNIPPIRRWLSSRWQVGDFKPNRQKRRRDRCESQALLVWPIRCASSTFYTMINKWTTNSVVSRCRHKNRLTAARVSLHQPSTSAPQIWQSSSLGRTLMIFRDINQCNWFHAHSNRI